MRALHLGLVALLIVVASLGDVPLCEEAIVAIGSWEPELGVFLVEPLLEVFEAILEVPTFEVAPLAVFAEDVAVFDPRRRVVEVLEFDGLGLLALLASVSAIEDRDVGLAVVEGVGFRRIRFDDGVEAAHVAQREEFVHALFGVVMVEEHRPVVGEVAIAMAVAARDSAVLVFPADIASSAHL
jgi:hypothetical protein